MARGHLNPKSPRAALAPTYLPPPPSRSRGARHPVVRFLNALMLLLVLAVIGAGALAYWGRTTFEAEGPSTEDTVITVAQGAGLASIASLLVEEGLISADDGIVSDRNVFLAAVRVLQNAGRLQAGEYAIPAGASMREIMEMMVDGRVLRYFVTFPEGTTSLEIVRRLNANPDFAGDLIDESDTPAEGTLMPSTYDFTRGSTRQAVLARMQGEMTAAVEEIWASRDPAVSEIITTREELVTLASIVEKETGVADERPRIAAAFLNRLSCPEPDLECRTGGMRLQADPTIIYGILVMEGSFNGDITTADLNNANNPYNTYQHDGLPPGPIANPGRAALEAVANPADTNELYFVADGLGTGRHLFAETNTQHINNRNIATQNAAAAAAAE